MPKYEISNKELFDAMLSGPMPENDACLVWPRGRSKGYGQVGSSKDCDDGEFKAHRLSWVLNFGPIPDGLRVLHKCDNPPCFRPSHLFLGTNADNVADMTAKGRRAGHPNGRLPPEQVLVIRDLYKQGWSILEMARISGYPRTLLYCAITGRTWSHIG